MSDPTDSALPFPLDAQLVDGVLNDEDNAINEFIGRIRCVARILNSLNGRSGRPFDAQGLDALTQEVLVAIWRKLSSYDGIIPLENWAYRICQLAFDQAARKSASARTKSAYDRDDVHQCLEGLPVEDARTIELRHFDELSFESVGQRLGISREEAMARYYRGRLALQEHLRSRIKERA